MDGTKDSSTAYSLQQMPESHRSFKRVALVCSDARFAADLMELPVGIRWCLYSGRELELVEMMKDGSPAGVVVCSNGGTLISGQRVCKAIRRKVTVPLMFINRGQYPTDYDLSTFSDVSVGEPRDFRDLLNLGIEILRLANDTPVPSVRVGMATASHRSTARWILTAGALIATLSGAITLTATQELESAITAAVTTFSAITSVEIGTLVRHYLQQRRQLS